MRPDAAVWQDLFLRRCCSPMNFENPFINDSKQLSEKKRNELRDVIQNNALDYAVASVDNIEIDKINILNASILAMHKAIDGLKRVKPEHLLVDGNRFKPYQGIPHTCIVHGDANISVHCGCLNFGKNLPR
jgi:ribonuclease HII